MRVQILQRLIGAHHSRSVRDHHTYQTCVIQVQIARGYRRVTDLHEEGESVHELEGHILEVERGERSEVYSSKTEERVP